MVFGEDRSTNLRRVVVSQRDGLQSDLIHRPGEGTSLREGWCRDLPENSELFCRSSFAASLSSSVPAPPTSQAPKVPDSRITGIRHDFTGAQPRLATARHPNHPKSVTRI
jgi:hypothetical protein